MKEKRKNHKKLDVGGVDKLKENLQSLPPQEKRILLSFFNELTIKWMGRRKGEK